MRFKIGYVEVLRRRQKRQNPCEEKWDDHDNEIRRAHIKKVGCRPPYMDSYHDEPLCSFKEEMRKSRFFLRSDDYGMLPPCTSMEHIKYKYEEASLDGRNSGHRSARAKNGTFLLGIYLFHERFKDISQIKIVIGSVLPNSNFKFNGYHFSK